MSNEVLPIAMPGIHEKFFPYFLKIIGKDPKELPLPVKSEGWETNIKILEVGAGHGAFTKKLYDHGFSISACDLFPEIFMFDKVECKKVDLTKKLPYENGSFDVIIAVEVMEHILDHESFFQECKRILRPNGKLIFSTPNIISLKSRIRFLLSGFYYSFKPLDLYNNDGLQHVASLTIDQYNYIGIRNGFEMCSIDIDKFQSTSKYLIFFYPLIYLYCRLKKIQIHNNTKLLLGRVLFITFQSKNATKTPRHEETQR